MQPAAEPSNVVPIHPRARIEHTPDPRQPGRIAYQITGPTRDCVQVVIDNLYASVEGGFGYANFVGPSRRGADYFALGQVVVYGLMPNRAQQGV